VVNLGTGRGVSIGEVVGKVLELVNRDVRVRTDEGRVRPEASEVMRLISDNSKAKRLMGWSPQVDFDTGLERVIEYIRTHPEQYKPEIYNV
jgi:nucleoside-diphosphate-sugar epimerase